MGPVQFNKYWSQGPRLLASSVFGPKTEEKAVYFYGNPKDSGNCYSIHVNAYFDFLALTVLSMTNQYF